MNKFIGILWYNKNKITQGGKNVEQNNGKYECGCYIHNRLIQS